MYRGTIMDGTVKKEGKGGKEKEEGKEGKEGKKGEAKEEEVAMGNEEAFMGVVKAAKARMRMTTDFGALTTFRAWMGYLTTDLYARELMFYITFTAIFTFGAGRGGRPSA